MSSSNSAEGHLHEIFYNCRLDTRVFLRTKTLLMCHNNSGINSFISPEAERKRDVKLRGQNKCTAHFIRQRNKNVGTLRAPRRLASTL